MDKPHVRLLSAPKGAPRARFVFAHGAGAGMQSDFMQQMAESLAAGGIEVWRFNFPYMQIASESGKRRPPNRMPVLLAAFAEELALVPNDLPLYIGGKSMGGRAATLLVADPEHQKALGDKVKGVVAMGYPFHPVGKPDKLRLEHLPDMCCPGLILQGERDTFGNRDEVAGYDLPESLSVAWLPDGDHSFKPRKASGISLAENYQAATAQTLAFIEKYL